MPTLTTYALVQPATSTPARGAVIVIGHFVIDDCEVRDTDVFGPFDNDDQADAWISSVEHLFEGSEPLWTITTLARPFEA